LSDDLFSVNPANKDEKFEVTIFDRDIRRCIKHRDYKEIWQWMTNYHHYWKFILFQDFRLLKRTVGKIFKDLFLKINYKIIESCFYPGNLKSPYLFGH